MSDLQYRRFWQALGWLAILLVIYLSTGDLNLPQIETSFRDKINHFLAYGFLMGWFGQLVRSGRWWLIALALVLLGMAMEVIQGMLPHRWFDLKDALANTAGVVIALGVLAVGGNRLLLVFERYWQSCKGG